MRRAAMVLVLVVALVGVGPSPAGAAETVSYGAHPRQVIDVYRPSTPGSNRPAVVFVHGGAYRGNKGAFGRAANAVAARGWVAFDVEYRTLDHTSQPWLDIPADVAAAVQWVKANAGTYGVDPSRVALVGHSAGAHLALLTAMRGSGPSTGGARVKAVVSWAGLTDLVSLPAVQGCPATRCDPIAQFASAVVQVFEGNCALAGCFTAIEPFRPVLANPFDAQKALDRYRSTSPFQQVDASDPPTLLAHSPADVVVPFEQLPDMAARLAAAGVPVEVHAPPASGHAFDAMDSAAWARTMMFLEARL